MIYYGLSSATDCAIFKLTGFTLLLAAVIR